MTDFWPEWLKTFAAEVPADAEKIVIPIGTVTGEQKAHLDRLLARSFAPMDKKENTNG
jgi:hypothetical protein